MKKELKKAVSLGIGICMILSLAACTGSGSGTAATTAASTTAAAATAAATTTATTAAAASAETTAAATEPAKEYPAYVTEPITIDFWHTYQSGTLADYAADVVKRFNEQNEYGITVVGTYMGSYADIRTQASTSIGAGTQPQVIINAMNRILANTDCLLDMLPYAERDGFDLSGFIEGVQPGMYYDGHLYNMPIQRSCPLLYYNKDMFAAAGYDEIPSDFGEFLQACKKVAEVNNVHGFELVFDAAFYQEALLCSLGSTGLCNPDENGADCLTDGSLLKLMTDWRQGIDEGWLIAPPVSDVYNGMYQSLYSGQLAAFFASSAVLNTVTTYGAEAGINVGVSPMPAYGGFGGTGGGGDVSIIASNNNEQQLAASWEFVKFLMSDEEIATRSKASGYLPVTEGSVKLMEDFFKENPNFATAFEARKQSTDVVGEGVKKSEWNTQFTTMMSYVIQDQSMTPEEGLDFLEEMSKTIFID